MKACVFKGAQDVQILEVSKPSLPKSGAIAKVLVSSICGTDIRSFRSGNEKLQDKIIGHEACFRIEEIDNEIEGFNVGDRIIIAPALGCGKCKSCIKGKTNMCDDLKTLGFEYPGTFAQFMAIPKRAFEIGNVIKVSGCLSDEEASIVEPAACAVNAQSFLDIQSDDNVLIYGAGYLGCIHSELALIKGAKRVILADVSQKRIDQANKDLKNVTVLNSSDKDFLDQIKKATNGEGVDVIITACPVGMTHKQGLEIINKNGRISLFGGIPGDGMGYINSNLIHYKEVGVFGAHASTAKQNIEVMELFAAGKINANKYFKVFKLEEAQEAFKALLSEDVTKALLNA